MCFPAGATSKASGTFYRTLEKELNDVGFIKMKNINVPYRVYYKPVLSNGDVVSQMTLKITKEMEWAIIVQGKEVNISESPFKELSTILRTDNMKLFISVLNSVNICEGNNDFEDLIQKRVMIETQFRGLDGEDVAVIESNRGVSLMKENFNIIRSKNCRLLIRNELKCEECKQLRKKLHAMRAIKTTSSKDSASVSSKVNYRYQSSEVLRKRLSSTQLAKKNAVQNVTRLTSKISKLVESEEVAVTSEQDSIIKEIIEKEKPELDENTPLHLLWQQQKERSSKSAKAMRWHPLIIRWCLSIYMTSPAAYRHISSKRNNFLMLPHVNTLKKYINYTKPSSGFNPDIIKELVEDSKLASLKDFQKNVSILFDEMKIQANLVYKKSTGKIVGFTEMGSINEEMSEFQRHVDSENVDEKPDRKLAQYVNLFMVRGIFTNLCYPFGYHASVGFKSDELFPVVWEATGVLESLGFKVRAWVCDGGSPNRRFLKMNAQDDKFNSVKNIFATDRDIYFFSDVPHLLKTTRNNLENSHGNQNTKNLMVSVFLSRLTSFIKH